MLLNYVEAFRLLNVNATIEQGRKPYKPALLLAVIDGIETGQIQNNQIIITPELIASFRVHREKLGATTPYESRNFAYPFFHLRGEGFWQLKEKPGMQIKINSSNSISGLNHLREVIAYARLDLNLWELLKTEKSRNILRNTLLAKY